MYRFTYIINNKLFIFDVLCRGLPDISAPDEPPKAPPQGAAVDVEMSSIEYVRCIFALQDISGFKDFKRKLYVGINDDCYVF